MLYETERHAVFFDPLIPEDDSEFWRWADARCRGRQVRLLETLEYHRRNRDELLARYGASKVAPESVTPLALPPAFEETLYWIPEQRALVVGDVLHGDGDGRISLCPPRWLAERRAKPTIAELVAALERWSDLDVESVLVSHGEPVLHGGAAALAAALAAAP